VNRSEQVELAAAVSESGALGSVGTALRGRAELFAQWERLRELTERPFAINHTVRPFETCGTSTIVATQPPLPPASPPWVGACAARADHRDAGRGGQGADHDYTRPL
jgi:NAD(P)H-dependent flavin oxidoreductase YrpB (nitropropane dioxygenase family)